MDAPCAKLSIHDGLKVRSSFIHQDFDVAFGQSAPTELARQLHCASGRLRKHLVVSNIAILIPGCASCDTPASFTSSPPDVPRLCVDI